MRTIWLISDTHFGHQNIIDFCNRPFATAKEMDEAMCDHWAETVKPRDIIYHLGDVALGQPPQLGKLPGRKRLVLGNHDSAKRKHLQEVFSKITMWRMFPEFGVLLTHVPVHESTLMEKRFEGRPMINAHGHIHTNASPPGPYVNVCVEKTDYRPIAIDEITP